jgi:hypothetical protein
MSGPETGKVALTSPARFATERVAAPSRNAWTGPWSDAATRTAIAIFVGLIAVWTEWRWGFGLADEGYLWYGAQRVVHGEVPLRDFMSYDPGRYLLAGAWMWLAGNDGILALRGLLGLLTVLSTAWACNLVGRAWCLDRVWRIVPAALLFVFWMEPRNKVFDIASSIALVATIAWVLRQPGRGRFALCGVVVGLLAILGRNHGIYALITSVLAGAWLAWQGRAGSGWRMFGAFVGGVILGYAPMWIGMLLIPGFAAAVWLSLQLMFDYGATNLPLPVAWPWTALVAGRFDMTSMLTGFAFAALPVFDVAGVLVLVWCGHRRRALSPLFVAAVCASIPYTHYAFSRANISHLSLSIMPLFFGVLGGMAVGPATLRRSVFLPLVLLLVSMPLLLPLHPRYDAHGKPWRSVQIGSDKLMLNPQEADAVDLLQRLYVTRPDSGPAFVAPLWPGAYALFGQRSPDWEIYPLIPRSAVLQEAEIASLSESRIGLAVVLDVPLDGNPALSYPRSHPQVFAYLRHCFTQRPAASADPIVLVFDGPQRCH